MKPTAAGLCVAAALACVASVGAQSSTSTTAGQSNNKAPHDVTLTGCLAKGANGGFVLNNARMEPGASSTTTAGATTTTGTTTTAGATTTGGATTTTARSATSTTGDATNAPAMTWMLAGGSDLDRHVGHKIQVTGKTSWDTSMDQSRKPASGTTSTTGTTTTTATTGSTSTTAGSATTASGQRDEPRVDVQSVKMISANCP